MRRSVLIAAIAVAFILDTVLLAAPELRGIRPDAHIALLVCLGAIMGAAPSAVLGAVLGVVMDICFNTSIGVAALPLIGAGVLGGLLHNKYFADNFIVPALAAAAVMVLREHFLFVLALLRGARSAGYFSILFAHILPASLLTGALAAAMHPILKRLLPASAKRRDIDRLR